MTPSKKCLPPSVGSTFSIFTNFHFIAINMHIVFVIFKNVLPAFGGEHIFAFYRLPQLHKKNANRNRLHFLRFSPPLGTTWNRLEIILGRLGVNLGQTWANLRPTWANLGPIWANLNPNWASLSQLVAALGPTWH